MSHKTFLWKAIQRIECPSVHHRPPSSQTLHTVASVAGIKLHLYGKHRSDTAEGRGEAAHPVRLVPPLKEAARRTSTPLWSTTSYTNSPFSTRRGPSSTLPGWVSISAASSEPVASGRSGFCTNAHMASSRGTPPCKELSLG